MQCFWCSGSRDVFAGGIPYLYGVSSAKKQLHFFQLTPKRQAFDFVQGSLQDPRSLKNFCYLWLGFVSLHFSGDCSPGPSQDPSVWSQLLGLCPRCRRAQAQQCWSFGTGQMTQANVGLPASAIFPP